MLNVISLEHNIVCVNSTPKKTISFLESVTPHGRNSWNVLNSMFYQLQSFKFVRFLHGIRNPFDTETKIWTFTFVPSSWSLCKVSKDTFVNQHNKEWVSIINISKMSHTKLSYTRILNVYLAIHSTQKLFFIKWTLETYTLRLRWQFITSI